MDFELTPEQQALQKAATDFARRELNSSMIERDAQQVFSRDGWEKCAAFGVQGMPIPNEYGGRGADPITTIAMMEGLGYGGSDQGFRNADAAQFPIRQVARRRRCDSAGSCRVAPARPSDLGGRTLAACDPLRVGAGRLSRADGFCARRALDGPPRRAA